MSIFSIPTSEQAAIRLGPALNQNMPEYLNRLSQATSACCIDCLDRVHFPLTESRISCIQTCNQSCCLLVESEAISLLVYSGFFGMPVASAAFLGVTTSAISACSSISLATLGTYYLSHVNRQVLQEDGLTEEDKKNQIDENSTFFDCSGLVTNHVFTPISSYTAAAYLTNIVEATSLPPVQLILMAVSNLGIRACIYTSSFCCFNDLDHQRELQMPNQTVSMQEFATQNPINEDLPQ